MSALLQCLGAYLVGFFLDRFGRKWPAVAGGAFTIIGTAVQFIATTRGALLAGKMINGFGIGAAMTTATTYASEVSSVNLH
jgi:MFS family permease